MPASGIGGDRRRALSRCPGGLSTTVADYINVFEKHSKFLFVFRVGIRKRIVYFETHAVCVDNAISVESVERAVRS